VKKIALWIVSGVVALLIGIQFIPLAGVKTNPPVLAEPQWDSQETRALAVRACYDCHSNETIWPWYSNVAPVSWSIIRHTNEGRDYLNFSEWNRVQEEAEEAAETVLDGSMPLRVYLITHGDARLSEQEKTLLAQGLQRTLGGELEQDSEAKPSAISERAEKGLSGEAQDDH